MLHKAKLPVKFQNVSTAVLFALLSANALRHTEELNDLGGRANILDDKDGVQTRGKNIDVMKQDRDVDAAVENAVQYDFETGGQKIPEPRK